MTPGRKTKVLVVEDSTVARLLLLEILQRDADIEVIGNAKNGVEAIRLLGERRPDVVLMDIHMPEMDGFEATRRIMETCPLPIVICSSTANLRDATTSFRLMEAGAVACVEKPVGMQHEEFPAQSDRIRSTLKLMAEVKVVRRWRRDGARAVPPPVVEAAPGPVELVAIGASTGGPPVVQSILAALPREFPCPIVVVQHIAPGFVEGLAHWFNQATPFKTLVASGGMRMCAGEVYLAPDDHHLVVQRDGTLGLNQQALCNGLRPAVNCLFQSVAEACGARAVGVLLTGMGKDGAVGLRAMRDRGALTLAQDRETSVVHGMPGEAIAIGAAVHVLPPQQIAGALARLAQRSTHNGEMHHDPSRR